MKTLFFLPLVLLLACGPEDATPTAPANDTFDPTGQTLLRQGSFTSSGSYTVTGTAAIYQDGNGNRTLVLDNFSSSNGPDLRVYLATTVQATSFVNLGFLKSTSGRQTYAIPAGTNVAEMRFALVWCQRFSVRFGSAETL